MKCLTCQLTFIWESWVQSRLCSKGLFKLELTLVFLAFSQLSVALIFQVHNSFMYSENIKILPPIWTWSLPLGLDLFQLCGSPLFDGTDSFLSLRSPKFTVLVIVSFPFTLIFPCVCDWFVGRYIINNKQNWNKQVKRMCSPPFGGSQSASSGSRRKADESQRKASSDGAHCACWEWGEAV